jgi:hypothetical protein
LDVEIEGRRLGDWEFDELRRPQVLALVDHMLRVEGRASRGVRGILSALSVMAEDAIGDDAATGNAFMGVKLRGNDPRIQKPPRKPRIWSFEQMREFAVGGRAEVRAQTRRPTDPRNRGRYKRKEYFYSRHDYEATPACASASSSPSVATISTGTRSASPSPPTKESWSNRAIRRTTNAPCRCRPALPS